VAQAAVQWLGSQLRPGDRLGAWTLLRPLGEGGMGRVFLAERSDGHYQQLAAIKLLLGWSGAEALARLTSERQILARLNHAHIAKLLDGGTTPSGQPYLVMEYADGDTIDAWCAQRQASLEDRLALFGAVCEAVAHAHRHLVIHCDIKPANALVNAEGRVMLLDFGIARLEGQGNDAAVGMTAGYASPEQAAGHAPGPPSDIFSLGRLLAELVRPVATGHRRAELAAIVARATAHEAERRYDSAGALQRDLRRLLAHQPVAAMGSGVYLLRKGLRRHWPWVLAVGAALVLTSALTARVVRQLDHADGLAAGLAAAQITPTLPSRAASAPPLPR
jgi:serine/threonine-protein kinase